MILTALSGRISDVIGTKKPIIAGFVICAVALFFLSSISVHTSIGHICIYLFPAQGNAVLPSPAEQRGYGRVPGEK